MFGPDEASVYDLSCLTLVSINSRKGNLFYVGRIRLVTGRTRKGAKPLDSIQFSPLCISQFQLYPALPLVNCGAFACLVSPSVGALALLLNSMHFSRREDFQEADVCYP